MNPGVFILFSLALLRLDITTANHLAAVGGGRDDNGVTNKCLDKERHALLHFKARLQDPDGSLSTWRAEDDDCCKWSGVTCNNRTGHVVELRIHGVTGRLAGEIGHSLLNLSYLNVLDLSANSFYGTIPKSLGSLTKLTYLDLGGNGFDGTIPRSIGSLTDLRYLDLSNNFLSETIPPEFGNLTKLQGLILHSVGSCRVENLEWLTPLSNLQQLSMDGISLAKVNLWVDVILSLPKLSFLSLQECDLGEIMYPYSSFANSSSSIVSLNLGNNNLNSSMYYWFFALTSNNLRHLDLSSNMLDLIPKYMGNLCKLEGLKLDNNSAVVHFPDFLNSLSGCTSLTLQVLSASHSQFTGSLSDEIQKFSSLEVLVLPENQLNGTLSEKLWELLRLEYLDVSFNYLRGAISKKIGKSKPYIINLSNNLLEGVPSREYMSNLSYVDVIDLSSCKIGPRFPKWIQTLKNLTSLDLANSTIFDTISLDFWDTWPSQLSYLNLSLNNIDGKVPDLSSNFDDSAVIDLSSNKFYGPIPNVSSNLASLNLSRNKFNGSISFLCQIVDGLLEFLDLSHNFLSGQLPDCLWNFKELKVLNLGHNNLFGRLPASVESLIKLEVLYLYKNDFYGELPLSLKNCSSINSLNLGANKFSGNVPLWIGENLSGLYVLILRSNNFSGTIPLQLCRLPNLQILDLSMNNFHGTIPSCVNNLTSMVQEKFSQLHNVNYASLFTSSNRGHAEYVHHAMMAWLGYEHDLRSNLTLFTINGLRFIKSIDLSSNNLTGQIPHELTNLYELNVLNLSTNALFGDIPRKIGQMTSLLALDLSRNKFSGQIPSSMSQMTSLLALDLSRNKFSGQIPSSMSQMTFLDILDVSFNKLSGRIPSSTQLQSFEPSRYDGNAGLCGPPLTKYCARNLDDERHLPPPVGKSEGDGEGIAELRGWFYIVGVLVLLLDF